MEGGKSRGGYRPGSGRKKKDDPRNTRSLSVTLLKAEWEELGKLAITPQKAAAQIIRAFLASHKTT